MMPEFETEEDGRASVDTPTSPRDTQLTSVMIAAMSLVAIDLKPPTRREPSGCRRSCLGMAASLADVLAERDPAKRIAAPSVRRRCRGGRRTPVERGHVGSPVTSPPSESE